MTGGAGQSLAARFLLCLALVLQLAALPACRAAATGSEVAPELAALGQVLGRRIVLCHAGAADDHGENKHADHHCCDCGLCCAATLVPPRSDGLGLILRVEAETTQADPRRATLVARGPSVVATSPRGPPVLA